MERPIRYAIGGQETRERLRRERDLIGRIMETSPVGIVVADQTGNVTFANQQAQQILTLAKETITQKSYSVLNWRLTDSEGNSLPGQASSLKQILESGRPVHDVCFTIDQRMHDRGASPGQERTLISVNAAALFDAANKIDGMVVTVEDITAH